MLLLIYIHSLRYSVSYRNIKRTVFYKFRRCNKGYLTSYGVKLRYYIFPSLYHAKWQTVKFLIIWKMNCPSDNNSCKIIFKHSSHVWFHYFVCICTKFYCAEEKTDLIINDIFILILGLNTNTFSPFSFAFFKIMRNCVWW